MAVDMYIREIDNLSFELSMNRCNDKLATLANKILIKGLILVFFSFSLLVLQSTFQLYCNQRCSSQPLNCIFLTNVSPLELI